MLSCGLWRALLGCRCRPETWHQVDVLKRCLRMPALERGLVAAAAALTSSLAAGWHRARFGSIPVCFTKNWEKKWR